MLTFQFLKYIWGHQRVFFVRTRLNYYLCDKVADP